MLDTRGALFRSWLAVLFLLLSACTGILGDFSVGGGGGPSLDGGFDAGDGGPQPNLGPIVVTPTTGLVTSEAGRTAQFTIVLKSKPTSSVVIGLDSSNKGEGIAKPGSVTFTKDNWSAPQTVTVTGQDDTVVDGNRTYTIITAKASSQDPTFANVDPPDVSVTNVDNESAGFTIVPDKGLTTSESGGEAHFTVVLNTKPKGNVTIALSSNDNSEGKIAPLMMVFTPDNWMAPQMATITGLDDTIPDGPQNYKIVTAPAVSPSDVNYDKVDPDDIDVVNEDNDTAGFTLNPKSGLVTNENGQMATFTMALNFAPSANVVVRLASNNTNEGIVSPTMVTFTPANWKAPQIITVSGLDDAVADGDQPYDVVTSPAESGDPAYNKLDPPDMTVTNVDNDSPGVTVKPAEGLVTTEAGGEATFTIVLNSRPNSDVTIALSSSLATEGKVNPPQVKFTRTSWNAPQTVTVTGVDDLVADGNMPYLIRTAPAVSDDPGYKNFDGPDVKVSNTDDDSAGFVVTPQMGLVTSEKGDFATFTIALTSKPTSDVRIALTSTNTDEGKVSPALLTFTKDNYRAPQTVTVTGVDDKMEDGNQVYRIATYNAESDDVSYKGLPVPDVEVTNNDDDSAGIFVRAVKAPLETSEKGDTASFTVVLTSQPAAMTTVTIPISSTNELEGTVSPKQLVFTGENWNAPRTVTITGVNDEVQDGNQEYRITIAKAQSTDPKYNDMDVPDPVVTNIDNDVAGITVKPPAMPTTSESGGTATFTVELNSRPTKPVTVRLASSLATEGTVSPMTLTFTETDWNAPQVVTATGQDDRIADGNQPYSIVTQPAVSEDPNYNDVNPADVTLINTDDDSPGILITPSTPLTTNEDGISATFSVRLQSQPTGDVVIAVRTSDATEGRVDVMSLVFTAANYNSPHTVTVTGVNDDVADGNQSYLVILDAATSNDAKYNGLNPVDVVVSNTDNDSPGITVSAAAGNTREDGTTTTFTVRLTSQPSGTTTTVTIPLSSSNVNEGTIMQPSLVFTTSNWSAPQTVTVRGVDDAVADGNQQYRAVLGPATSSDMNYDGLDATDVVIVNVDNDKAGITVSAAAGNTTEGGGTTTFSVVLDSQPTADVTIPMSSSNVNEGTVMLSALTFTTVNWSAPQTVTVRGVDDFVADGNQPYRIRLEAATGGDYAGIDPLDVEITNVDDDSPGFIVTPTTGLVTGENGATATFTVRLTSEPLANVTIGVHSSDVTEGASNVANLTFTPANYSAPQTVTVRGLDDNVADGNQTYRIILDPAMSTDPNYSSRDPEDVTASNTDNDSAGISVSLISGNTTEAGGQATFTVVLNSQPTASVTLNFNSNDLTEGTVDKTSLIFTDANWNGVQTVTVTGVNDNLADGEQPYAIVFTGTASTDAAYAAITPNNVLVRNTDNDSAGITVSSISGKTSEAGQQATFTVVLNSEPTGDVTVHFNSNDTTEGTVDRTALTFTNQNWNSPQTVRVTGVDDLVADGEQQYAVVFTATTGADAAYNALPVPGNVAVANTDNDSAGITVSTISGKTNEGGGQATFTVVLNSQPTADVTVNFNSNDTTEGTVNRTNLTFTALNWNAPQTVIVTGVNDDQADGEQQYSIVFTATMSGDAAYAAIVPNPVAVANADNDSAGIKVTVLGSVTTELGGQATFTVALQSQPVGDVTVHFNSSDTTEGTVNQTSLTFTSVNWASAQSVIVTGQDDAVADGNQPYAVVFTQTTGMDTAYNAITPGNVNLTNNDNDIAAINVSAISGKTSEDATQATFTVNLNSQPAGDVTVNFNTNDPSEGTVNKTSLTFTTANWAALQTVTVTGVNDNLADGEQQYAIVFSATTGADPAYNALPVPGNVAVANMDNDTAGILVSPISGKTSEAGGSATFTVVLTSQPTAQVVVHFDVNDATEGTLNGVTSLTFNPGNWDGVQTVTVTGVNDFEADSEQDYAVVFTPTTSTDPGYSGITPANVAVKNTDNDSAGFTVSAISGNTSESGGTATFTVVLNSQPVGGASVSVNLNSTNTGEGTVSPGTLTFDPSGPNAWNVLHTVTVTGVNDFVADGPQGYAIHFSATSSADPAYNNKTLADVAVTNTDNDSAGIHVSATTLTTTEAMGESHTKTFSIRLNSQPVGDVTIAFNSLDSSEGTLDFTSVLLTPMDWSAEHVVTVTGVDEFVADGDQTYAIRFTSITAPNDANYAGLTLPGDITVTNMDNDAVGITVSASSLTTSEDSLSPSHAAQFTIVLNSQPTAGVTVNYAMTMAGAGEGLLSPMSSVSFTTGDWNAPKTVTVTGVDDFEVDGSKQYFIQFTGTTGGDYAGITPAQITVTNLDNDTAGITLTLVPAGVCSTTTGTTATFEVKLRSEPTSSVTVNLAVDDPNIATVSAPTVTFAPTPGDWSTARTVTVTGGGVTGPFTLSATGDMGNADPNYRTSTAATPAMCTNGP